MNNLSLLKIWLMFFVFVLALAIFVQFILLPHVFPSFHAGDGLLKGGDWIYFHHLAVDLSQKIKSEGWSAWELRPEGQTPAGIAAVIYTLTVPKPWTLIPLNAALHATAVIVLLLIILQFINDRKIAFIAILPFVFFPSAMTWYTQIHKDGYFILGNFLLIYGWLLFIQTLKENNKWQQTFKGILLIELGAFFVWLVRPYGVQMLQGLTLIVNIIISFILFFYFVKRKIYFNQMIIAILLCWSVFSIMTPLTKGGIIYDFPSMISSESISEKDQDNKFWKKSDWIPDSIESKFYSIALVRERYRKGYPEAGSKIYTNISFHSLNDVLKFIPKALGIVLFAPFPNDWLKEGTAEWNTMMRKISGFEMVVVYISLFTFIFFLFNNWRNT
ncbi:MAG: hypothetical protein GX432_14510, partial [Candidatus Atribacteria bacterium]|nr:hypothetical protein [Candidatus Atribacteria bacterium]